MLAGDRPAHVDAVLQNLFPSFKCALGLVFIAGIEQDQRMQVAITGVKDDAGNLINDGTVTAVLKDSTGNPVTNANALTFAYVASSDGNYSGIVPHNADLLDGRDYTLEITIVKDGKQALLQITRTAAYITM